MRKKILVLGAGVLLLAGCGTNAGDPENHYGNFRTGAVTLDDGRTVECVTWKAFEAGGMSCDWANAR